MAVVPVCVAVQNERFPHFLKLVKNVVIRHALFISSLVVNALL